MAELVLPLLALVEDGLEVLIKAGEGVLQVDVLAHLEELFELGELHLLPVLELIGVVLLKDLEGNLIKQYGFLGVEYPVLYLVLVVPLQRILHYTAVLLYLLDLELFLKELP